jgi:hypothetical protein
MLSVSSQPTFRRNMSPPSSECTIKRRKEQRERCEAPLREPQSLHSTINRTDGVPVKIWAKTFHEWAAQRGSLLSESAEAWAPLCTWLRTEPGAPHVPITACGMWHGTFCVFALQWRLRHSTQAKAVPNCGWPHPLSLSLPSSVPPCNPPLPDSSWVTLPSLGSHIQSLAELILISAAERLPTYVPHLSRQNRRLKSRFEC